MCLTSTPRDFMPSKHRFESATRTRIMLASLGNTVTPPSAASAADTRARSLRSTAAWRAYSSAWSSANSVASALSTLML